jgi:hypothetical protein
MERNRAVFEEVFQISVTAIHRPNFLEPVAGTMPPALANRLLKGHFDASYFIKA